MKITNPAARRSEGKPVGKERDDIAMYSQREAHPEREMCEDRSGKGTRKEQMMTVFRVKITQYTSAGSKMTPGL